jgi:Zn-dependent protease with chaperone function
VIGLALYPISAYRGTISPLSPMPIDIIPYEPYHPHLGYTLAIACQVWIGVALYSRHLSDRAHARTALYALAIVLPVYGEVGSYLISLIRPAPETPLGYELTHINADLLDSLPLDTRLSPHALSLLAGLAMALVALSIARLVYGTLRLRRRLASARPLVNTAHVDLARRLASTAGALGFTTPRVFVTEIDAPLAFTTGLVRPSIYVTTSLMSLLSVDEVIAVLCHEWAHVLRRDNLWNALVRLMRDTLWFLPGGYLAWRRMIMSQDEVCDALAVRMTGQPLVLARALVKVASARAPTRAPSATDTYFSFGYDSLHARVEQMIRLHEVSAAGEDRPAYPVGVYLFIVLFLLLAILPALLGS